MAYTIATIIFVLDQVTKALVEAHIPYSSHVTLSDGFFHLVNTRNTGAAWSLFSDLTFSRLLLSAVSLAAAWLIAVAIQKAKSKSGMILLGIVLGGTVGNMVDRIRLGYVTDFFSFTFGKYAFPAFNVADMAITLGALIIVIKAIADRGFIDKLFPWLDKTPAEKRTVGLDETIREALEAIDEERDHDEKSDG
ncbi:MAG TPA: signal peptidase II [Fastidiosipila sp.]|jgi:signal peptidase II|nr:signal peptidase II [Fastidiosipila sp.]